MRISIDFLAASATVTRTPAGRDEKGDGGAYSCYPAGDTQTDDLRIVPGYMLCGLPLDAHFTVGVPVTWRIVPVHQVFHSTDEAVTWLVNDAQIGADSITSYTFSDSASYTVTVQLRSRDCFMNSLTRKFTIDTVIG